MTTTIPAGWLPIESAPKDGTEILAWREDCGKFIASYTSADAFPLTQAELDAYDEATLFAKDWFTQWPDATRLDGSEVPTLWQPLPADPCPTCNDQGAVGNILTAQPCPDCAAPGVSTVEDERQAFEAWAEDQGFVLDCDFFEVSGQYYDQDDTQLAYDIWRAARASVAAPAAGDALTGSAPEWATCESRGPWARNSLKAAIDLLREKETRARHAYTKDYMGLPARYIADAYGEAAAVVERKLGAIAAQRKGDA